MGYPDQYTITAASMRNLFDVQALHANTITEHTNKIAALETKFVGSVESRCPDSSYQDGICFWHIGFSSFLHISYLSLARPLFQRLLVRRQLQQNAIGSAGSLRSFGSWGAGVHSGGDVEGMGKGFREV